MRNSGKDVHVARRCLEQEWLNESSAKQRDDQADRDANTGRANTTRHDKLHNVATARSQRHANAEFLTALRNQVRHYAVQTDGRDTQRKQSHQHEDVRAQLPRAHLGIDGVLEAVCAHVRNGWINFLRELANVGYQRR